MNSGVRSGGLLGVSILKGLTLFWGCVGGGVSTVHITGLGLLLLLLLVMDVDASPIRDNT